MTPDRVLCPHQGCLRSHHGVSPVTGISVSRAVSAPSRDICAPSRALPRAGTGSRFHPAFLRVAPSLVSLPLSAVVLRGLFGAPVGEGLFSRFPVSVPAGTSKLSLWRELRDIRGAQERLEAPGCRRSPPALWDTCDLLFCVLFHLSIPFPWHSAGQQRHPRGMSFRGSHSRAPACAHERGNE